MKRIVICADGTWNTPDQFEGGKRRPTNVTRLALSVAPRDDDGVEQLVFYDKGVGTSRTTRFLGGAFGIGLSGNVKDAYRFLVHNYEPGDELYFFGFSRGAYTVRSTVGMIRNCGLLRRPHAKLLRAAYQLYRRRDPASEPTKIEAQLFRKTYSHEIGIHFIGVWDTVGALGIPLSWFGMLNRGLRFHDVELSSWVGNAFQALAIDECRKPFKPCIWSQQESGRMKGQRMEQRWFAGVHSNVGGGYSDTGLSDLAFEWMADNAQSCGLALDASKLDPPVGPAALGAMRNSMTWFYKLFGRYLRPIDEAVDVDGKRIRSNESVAQAAIERFQAAEAAYRPAKDANSKDVPYKPDNLRAYLENTRTPVASEPLE